MKRVWRVVLCNAAAISVALPTPLSATPRTSVDLGQRGALENASIVVDEAGPVGSPAGLADPASLRLSRALASGSALVEVIGDRGEQSVRSTAGASVVAAGVGLTLARVDAVAYRTLSSAGLTVREPVSIAQLTESQPEPEASAATATAAVVTPPKPNAELPTVKVGVIDVYNFVELNRQVAAGKLRAIPSSRRFCRNRGVACVFASFRGRHGNAVAEIVHSQAGVQQPPVSVELYLAEAYTLADYRATIDWFASNGVKVINHSLMWMLDGPGDGTGPSASIVDYAVAKGMVWVNPVGDAKLASRSTYRGPYWRGTWSDSDGDRWLAFNGRDESMGVYCGAMLGLRWSDWGTARTDYDLYASDVNIRTHATGSPIKISSADQSKGALPLEANDGRWLCNTDPASGPVYDKNADGFINLWVRRETRSAHPPTGDVIELMLESGWFEHAIEEGSAVGAFTDTNNRGAVVVGNRTTGSLGPNRRGTQKPDGVAHGCYETLTYGDCTNQETGFFSSQASTAAGTAVVASTIGWMPPGTPLQVGLLVRDNALRNPQREPAPSNRIGYGDLYTLQPTAPLGPSYFSAYDEPSLLLDTRALYHYDGPGPLRPGAAYMIGNFAPDVSAALLSVTVTQPSKPGWTQIYAHGSAFPGTSSSLNVEWAGQTVTNLVVVPVSSGGRVMLHTESGGHYSVHLRGAFFTETFRDRSRAGFVPTDSYNAFNSRASCATCGALRSGVPRNVVIARPGDVLAQTRGGGTVVLSVTVSGSTSAGWIDVGSVGVDYGPPEGYFSRGETVTFTAVVRLPFEPDERIQLRSSTAVHASIDVVGWFNDYTWDAIGGAFQVVRPTRILDSRAANALPPAAGVSQIATVSGAPANAAAAWFNVTALRNSASGAVYVSERSHPRSTARSVSMTSANRVRSSLTLSNLRSATATVTASVATHRIIDVAGYFLPGAMPMPAGDLSWPRGLNGEAPNDHLGGWPHPLISRDGVRVLFGTKASNLVAGDSVGSFDYFVWDRASDEVIKLPLDSAAPITNERSMAFSADGSKVAIWTAQALSADDVDGAGDVYVVDLTTMSLQTFDSLYAWSAISASLSHVTVWRNGMPPELIDTRTGVRTTMPAQYGVSALSEDGRFAFLSNFQGNVSDPLRVARYEIATATFVPIPLRNIWGTSADGQWVSGGERWTGDPIVISVANPTLRRTYCEFMLTAPVGFTDDMSAVVHDRDVCVGNRSVPFDARYNGRKLTFAANGQQIAAGGSAVVYAASADELVNVAGFDKYWVFVYDPQGTDSLIP